MNTVTNLRGLFVPGKYPEVDGLRGMAISLVFFTHIIENIPGVSLVRAGIEWCHPLYNGWIGVDLFFVLSGFLIGGQIIAQINAGNFRIKEFYLKRFFRILPAYFSILLFIVVLLLVTSSEVKKVIGIAFTWEAVFKNVLLVTNYYPADLGVGSWSLSVEEQFYLIVPCALIALRKTKRITTTAFFVLIMFASLLFRIIAYKTYNIDAYASWPLLAQKIYFPFHTRMDSLAGGVLVSLMLTKKHPKHKSGAPVIKISGFLLASAIFVFGSLAGGLWLTTLQYTGLAVGFSCFLFGVLCTPSRYKGGIDRFLSHRFWTPIVRLSYSIYLTHLLVLQLHSNYFANFPQLKFTLMPISMVIVTILLSLLLYTFVENPLHRFALRKFSRHTTSN